MTNTALAVQGGFPEALRLDVPFHTQDGYQSSVAAVRMAVEYFGHALDMDGARTLLLPTDNGYIWSEAMAVAPTELGLTSAFFSEPGRSENVNTIVTAAEFPDSAEVALARRDQILARAKELGIRIVEDELTADDFRAELGASKNIAITMVDWATVMAESSPVHPTDYFGKAVPLVGFDSDGLLVHCHEPFFRIADTLFDSARGRVKDRSSIFITGAGIRPTKQMDICGFGQMTIAKHRAGFFDIDWDAVYAKFHYGGCGSDLPDRFEDYARTGVVDFDYEINVKGYQGARQFLNEDGSPNLDAIIDELNRGERNHYNEIFMAIPDPEALQPADLKRMQDAILTHLNLLFDDGRVPSLFECLRKFVQRYFNSFELVEERIPRMIHRDVCRNLRSYESWDVYGQFSDNIDDIRRQLEQTHPSEANEICAQILDNTDLFNFFNWIYKEDSLPLLAAAEKRLVVQDQVAGRLGHTRQHLLEGPKAEEQHPEREAVNMVVEEAIQTIRDGADPEVVVGDLSMRLLSVREPLTKEYQHFLACSHLLFEDEPFVDGLYEQFSDEAQTRYYYQRASECYPYMLFCLYNEISGEPFETAEQLRDNFAAAVNGKSILELGCGPGYGLAVLKKLGANVRGIDFHQFPDQADIGVDIERLRLDELKEGDVEPVDIAVSNNMYFNYAFYNYTQTTSAVDCLNEAVPVREVSVHAISHTRMPEAVYLLREWLKQDRPPFSRIAREFWSKTKDQHEGLLYDTSVSLDTQMLDWAEIPFRREFVSDRHHVAVLEPNIDFVRVEDNAADVPGGNDMLVEWNQATLKSVDNGFGVRPTRIQSLEETEHDDPHERLTKRQAPLMEDVWGLMAAIRSQRPDGMGLGGLEGGSYDDLKEKLKAGGAVPDADKYKLGLHSGQYLKQLRRLGDPKEAIQRWTSATAQTAMFATLRMEIKYQADGDERYDSYVQLLHELRPHTARAEFPMTANFLPGTEFAHFAMGKAFGMVPEVIADDLRKSFSLKLAGWVEDGFEKFLEKHAKRSFVSQITILEDLFEEDMMKLEFLNFRLGSGKVHVSLSPVFVRKIMSKLPRDVPPQVLRARIAASENDPLLHETTTPGCVSTYTAMFDGCIQWHKELARTLIYPEE